MKVLLLSWSDMYGGAARAAFRLHGALRTTGIDSQMLVAAKASEDATVLAPQSLLDRFAARVAPRWDQMPLRRYGSRRSVLFSPSVASTRTVSRAARIERDITHIHWVTNGFLRIEEIAKIGGPLVWSLHDVWALTGGCHYTAGCERYMERCGCCPVLDSNEDNDLAREVWERKHRSWAALGLTVVASSRWMARMAQSSALFRDRRIEVIPNCVDTDLFQPADRAAARAAFALPQQKRVLLFGALSASGDRRKGFHLLAPALQRLAERVPRDSISLAIMGVSREESGSTFPFETHYLGVVEDEARLAMAYAAADVLVVPSLEDNLPNMVMEAMSCGTPCVAFAIGGMPDMIEHEENGYLAEAYDTEDLARGMEFVLGDRSHQGVLGDRARQSVVARFAPGVVARRHIDLYKDILAGRAQAA